MGIAGQEKKCFLYFQKKDERREDRIDDLSENEPRITDSIGTTFPNALQGFLRPSPHPTPPHPHT